MNVFTRERPAQAKVEQSLIDRLTDSRAGTSTARSLNGQVDADEKVANQPSPNEVYTALKAGEFRVMRVFPGDSNSPVQANLEVRLLDDLDNKTNTGYQAISYAWEDTVFSHEMYLEDGKVLPITKALHTALRHLRDDLETRVLWADGACIDQTNKAERSAQVAIMYEIYSRASKVVVWLGENTADDELAFTTLIAAHKASTTYRQHEHAPTGLSLAWQGVLSCLRLTNKLWFKRLWVAQEVRAATWAVIRCGRYQIQSPVFIQGLAFFVHLGHNEILTDWYAQHHRDLLREPYADMSSLRPYETGEDFPCLFESNTFETLMALSRRQCTLPHDRVYASLALLGLNDDPGLKPDYTVPVNQVFAEFTLALLDRTELDSADTEHVHPSALLKMATLQREWNYYGVPSWVPDYHHLEATPRETNRLYEYHNQHSSFQISRKRFNWGRRTSDWHCIGIRGRCFADVVTVLSDSQFPDEQVALGPRKVSVFEELGSWYKRCKQHIENIEGSLETNDSQSQPNSSSRVEANEKSVHGRPSGSVVDFVREAAQVLDPGQIPFMPNEQFERACKRMAQPLPSFNVLPKNYGAVLASIRTARGLKVAWVPKETREGDQLAFLCGAPQPFALRACGTDAERTWQLLGDAWVSKLPEWQAMGLPESLKEAYEQEVLNAVPGLTQLRQRAAQAWKWQFLVADGWDGAQVGEDLLAKWEKENIGWLVIE